MIVVRDGSNLGNCAGSVADFVEDFVAGLWRICVGFVPDFVSGLAGDPNPSYNPNLAPTSSIPRQSDEVALKPNLF